MKWPRFAYTWHSTVLPTAPSPSLRFPLTHDKDFGFTLLHDLKLQITIQKNQSSSPWTFALVCPSDCCFTSIPIAAPSWRSLGSWSRCTRRTTLCGRSRLCTCSRRSPIGHWGLWWGIRTLAKDPWLYNRLTCSCHRRRCCRPTQGSSYSPNSGRNVGPNRWVPSFPNDPGKTALFSASLQSSPQIAWVQAYPSPPLCTNYGAHPSQS